MNGVLYLLLLAVAGNWQPATGSRPLMASVLEQAGATREPSEYAALTMDRGVTGLWTQRSPLRDADVPYREMKYYAASRFDSILDGINREITAKLTWKRRAGSSVYNSNTFPAGHSFYPYKSIQNGVEILRLLYDGKDGKIYDATAGQKSTLFTKSAGAGKARFAGVNTELFFSDGVDNQKWLFPGPWLANTSVTPGTLINVGAEPGTMQMALGGITLPIVAWASNGAQVTLFVDPNQVPRSFPNLAGASVAFSGFGGAIFLNGNSYPVESILSTNLGIFRITLAHAATARTSDSGSGSTGNGTTGGSAPSFSTTQFALTADSGQQWKCYGPAIEKWGLEVPATPPTLTPINGTRYWQPNTSVGAYYSIPDSNGNVQVNFIAEKTGATYPRWSPLNVSPNPAATMDGTAVWLNLGPPGTWQATTAYVLYAYSNSGGLSVILDSNGNLQWAFGGGTSGATVPTWATTVGSPTTDGGVTWRCLGPGAILASATVEYSYSTHGIDGSVSTAAPLSAIMGGILGPMNPQAPTLTTIGAITIIGAVVPANDTQIDQVWIWRTAQGQPTLVLEDQIPVDGVVSAFSYFEQGVTDTSISGGGALIPFQPAPIASTNNPPPVGMTAPIYHLGRIWAIYKNTVIRSGGPDTLTGNGNTAFAPLSFTPLQEQPIRLLPTITSVGPGMLVWGRANIYIILGEGTATNPFKPAALYQQGGGILNYDAVTQIGSTFYGFGNTALVGGNLIGKAFAIDPGAGYVEYGFPIGDQFSSVTTGAGGRIPNSGAPLGYLYNPASTYVTWAELGSGDTALYVADGAVGWFRYSPVASPESGFLWSPRAVIVGGTSAVQGVETQPGVTQLLIAPASSGPILFRDSSVSTDWSSGAPVAYPSYDVKGCIQLCLSGEVAEIAHVHVVSLPQGARPFVGLLFGEILASTAAPFAWYERTSAEPPNLKASSSVYSDRYTMLSKGVTPKCLFFQLGMDYGTQAFPDETLMFSIFGAKYAERRQQ